MQANELPNMLFYLEIWPKVPPDFQKLSSFRGEYDLLSKTSVDFTLNVPQTIQSKSFTGIEIIIFC